MDLTLAHDRDHERLSAAWDRWVALGRPRVHATNDPGGKKRAARRALGLRLQAHLMVCHKLPDVWGPRGRFDGFADAKDWHDSLQPGKGAR
jgi:hypothetical protein